jgi:hypothetical protein
VEWPNLKSEFGKGMKIAEARPIEGRKTGGGE